MTLFASDRWPPSPLIGLCFLQSSKTCSHSTPSMLWRVHVGSRLSAASLQRSLKAQSGSGTSCPWAHQHQTASCLTWLWALSAQRRGRLSTQTRLWHKRALTL